MTIGSYGRRCRARRRRVHRRLTCLIPAFVLASLITTTAAGRDPRNGDTRPVAAGEVAAAADLPSYGAISNGTVRLGINPEGHIDVLVDGIEQLGLQYLPTGADALIPGCWCEGWGVADLTSSTAGWASVAGDNGSVSPNLTVTGFDVTAETADSTVEVGGRLRVRHVYRPSPRPELYQVDLTVENVGGASADVVYRRAMDWDVPPTEFDEFVTIQGSHPQLLDSTDNGFNHVNPLSPLLDLGARGTFKDVGPDDRGGVFDFALGRLAPGASARLTMFYGAAASEVDALAALAAVDADLYSLGQPNAPDGPTLGKPNTFMFGVTDGATLSGPVIAAGRLVVPVSGPPFDGDPTAVSGSVAVYLPSTAIPPSQDTLIATAATDSDGTFTLRTPLTPALAAAASANDGHINLDLVANVNGWVYHQAIIRAFVSGAWVNEDGLEPAELVLTPINDLMDARFVPGAAGGASTGSLAYGSCTTYRFPIASARAWTTIGELHTPADTKLASFTYGRKADSYISKAISLDGTIWKLAGGSIKLSDEPGSGSSAEVGISHGLDRWAKEIQSEFLYTKFRAELVCGGLKVSEHFEIKATDWVGNARTGADLTYLDNRCSQDHYQHLAENGRNTFFNRESSRYGTFVGAATVSVAGATVSLNARSGMSRYVRAKWEFGAKSARHVLCGTDALPPTSSRIFAGA